MSKSNNANAVPTPDQEQGRDSQHHHVFRCDGCDAVITDMNKHLKDLKSLEALSQTKRGSEPVDLLPEDLCDNTYLVGTNLRELIIAYNDHVSQPTSGQDLGGKS